MSLGQLLLSGNTSWQPVCLCLQLGSSPVTELTALLETELLEPELLAKPCCVRTRPPCASAKQPKESTYQ